VRSTGERGVKSLTRRSGWTQANLPDAPRI
jgi:hypothetical protein